MKKEEKGTTVAALAEDFGRASIALISEYKGMKAAESDDMRRRIRAVRGEFRVTKNTLLRRAIKDTNFAPLDGHLGGPVGLILSYADPVELAKTISSFKELGEKFKIRGGVLDGKPLTPAEINELANLPPREVIMAQLLGLLQAPATQLVRLLNEPGSMVARLVDAIGRKTGEAGPAANGDAPATKEAAASETPASGAAPGAVPASGTDASAASAAAPTEAKDAAPAAETPAAVAPTSGEPGATES
jgi:large subunit ribosomal protein L10